MNKKLIPLAILGLYGLQTNAIAEEASAKLNLSTVVISATRVEQNIFDVPASIDVVDQSSIQDSQLGMTLSESIIRVPGITAQNRNQLAQDPQISSRGFGSRSTFGVSGVKLYVDNIPFTMPDGITQPGNIDLESVSSMEVLKGPFSAMYGSSAGGVISLKTQKPPKDNELSASFLTGSYGTTKESVQATGTMGGIGYLINESIFDSNGYRDNSRAHKKQSTVKFNFDLSEATHIDVLADYMQMNAMDPLGLAGIGSELAPKWPGTSSIPLVSTNPRATTTSAISAKTRVARENTQVGVNLEHTINESNKVNLVVYAGHRNNSQYLSTSTTSNSGRNSAISRGFWGSEISWTNKGLIFDRKYAITTGVSYAKMSDDRLDINAAGGQISTTSKNRYETDDAMNIDEFIQGQLAITNNIDLHAGIRNIHSKLSYTPHQTQAIKGGSLNFNNTTPTIGALWKVTERVNLFANYGKGFQSPNSSQTSYSNFDGSGPNLNLAGSTSDNYEAGIKSYLGDNTTLNATVFKVISSNEIAIDNTLNSYTVYRNLPVDTERKGLELSANSKMANNFEIYGAYTYMDAKYNGAFNSLYCVSAQTNPTNAVADCQSHPYGQAGSVWTKVDVASGNTIPGTYNQQFYGQISWKYPDLGFRSSLEGIINSRVYATDTNKAYAPGYSILNLRAGFTQKLNNWELSEYALIGNLLDRDYISSVRVNDSNGAYYEAGTRRNYMVGLSVTSRF